MKIDTNSIAHTTWNCKYHIVFGPCQVIVGFLKNKRSPKKQFNKRALESSACR